MSPAQLKRSQTSQPYRNGFGLSCFSYTKYSRFQSQWAFITGLSAPTEGTSRHAVFVIHVCIQSRCSCWTLFVLKWKVLKYSQTERAIKEMNFYGVWAYVHLWVFVLCYTNTHTHTFICMSRSIQNDIYIYFLWMLDVPSHSFLRECL